MALLQLGKVTARRRRAAMADGPSRRCVVEDQSQIGANTPEKTGLEVKELMAIRCIADDSAADHGHKR